MLNAALTRRTTLLAGAALGAAALASGCSDGAAAHDTADARLRSDAARDSQDLLDRYDATRAAHPALRDRLSPLRAHVAAHLAAFRGRDGGGGTSSGSPAGAASPSASSAGAAHRIGVPGGEKAARTALADAERRIADSRTRALGSASPTLARLLASVAAAGAAHAYLLGEDH